MANYKLSKLAKEDLMRIHEYGTRNFGEARADKYFAAFFDRFEEIAQRPYSFEDVSYIASDTEDASQGWTPFTSELKMIR